MKCPPLLRLGLTSLILSSIAAICGAQEADRPYDGIQAGLDAFRMAEERRQAVVGQQVYLNDRLRVWSTFPPIGQGNYWGGSSLYGVGGPVGWDYGYAYGNRRGARYYRESTRYLGGAQVVIEPWPNVPGSIWGYNDGPYVRQPIGQKQTQTGPNRWESHPIYDSPLPDLLPLPPVDSPALDKTPYATRREPRTETPVVKPKRRDF